MNNLSKIKTIEEFEKGYWYLTDLKKFAKKIGVKSISRLRKDEIEKIIKNYLSTGKIIKINKKKSKAVKDIEIGLKLSLPIINYTSNKITKTFIKEEALKIDKDLKEVSGVWYRLNRWRENKLEKKVRITYKDLINEYIRLNKNVSDFKRIPQGRYINFLADYLRHEKSSSRKEAIEEWHKLKKLDIPKTYKAWKKHKKYIK